MLQPSGDDGSMKSIVVGTPGPDRVTLTPASANSYFYTQFGCLNTTNTYGGLSMRIKAPAGVSFTVELQYFQNCGDANAIPVDMTTTALGWTFDGTEKLYSFKFSQFAGIDPTKLNTMLITGFSKAISLGPIEIYCGNTVQEYIPPTVTTISAPNSTETATVGTAAAQVIDKFANQNTNALGMYHGYDTGMVVTWGTGKVTLSSPDPDFAFYTQFGTECTDYSSYNGMYLHIAYTGSTAFTIALQQHNQQCSETINPYPATWDEVEAGRYAQNGNIYVPMADFNIDKTKTIGLAFKGFYTSATVTLTLVEIVKTVPTGWQVPSKLPTGNLIFQCTRPNSFAFCIDDGDPQFAQQVIQTVRAAGIKVTFFTLGAPLADPTTNLSNVYKEMMADGHQIAVHSYTHPKMEGLADYNAIDWEFNSDLAVVGQLFNLKTSYFRPPFGTEGARTRYRWTVASGRTDANIVNWDVDVQDWVWAMTSTPQNQITAFQSDVDKGGNLVVMHYLYQSTVDYLPQFIAYAKATGKQLMRLDQCMMDPK
jgi:peptidoglycan/xylan/chitin deacetylase (PgdA/CDA1 family)